MSLKIVSWNVNSLRSAMEKGFCEWLEKEKPDIVCLQEVRAAEANLRPIESKFVGYHAYWQPALKPGYSGVAVLTRFEPQRIEHGLNNAHDPEGRALTLNFGSFRIGSFYAPNATPGTEKIPKKIEWLQNFAEHITYRNDKPLFLCGDFNVACTEKDSQNVPHPKNMNGCTDEERHAFSTIFTACNLTDPTRNTSSNAVLSTWWSVSPSLRSMQNGIRYDYILIQKRYETLIIEPTIQKHIEGSDHCPVSLTANISTVDLKNAQSTGQSSFL